MTTYTSTQAKNNFGKLLDEVRKGPITIERNGRPQAVVISFNEYEATRNHTDEDIRRLSKTPKSELIKMTAEEFNNRYGYLLDE